MIRTFDDYQAAAVRTAIYPYDIRILYPALGLAGEAGEVANKVKKIYRDDGGQVTDDRRAQIAKELGGVLWYVATVCTDLNLNMGDVARENVAACGLTDRVALLEGDLFAALESLGEAERQFDLVAVNPPYVSEADMAGLMPEVRDHEPRKALSAGPAGLAIIDRVLAEAPPHVAEGGHVLMEIGYDQAGTLRERMETSTNFELAGIRKDLSGHERVVHLRRR